MADSIAFTLSLIDRMSGPAKAAASAISTLNDQVRALKDSLASVGQLSIKIPKLGNENTKKATEQIGPAFGPGRKEAEASAKYAQKEQDKLASAAKALEKQRSAAQYAEYQKQERAQAKALADAERLTVGYHVKQLQRSKAEEKAREQAEKALGLGHSDALNSVGQASGAGGILGQVSSLKQLGAAFEEVTGLGAGAALGIVGVAGAAVVATAVVYKFAEAVGGWIIEGAKMALEASEAREKTLDLLSAMLGSEDAANQVTSAIGDITKVTNVAGSRVAQLARELAAAGESGDLLTSSMKAIAQAESVLPEGGEKLQKITERAIQTGKFALSPKQLVGTGLQVQKLYEEIARRTGIGVKQVEAELKAGKVSAETGIAAMNAVISDKFGGVAAKRANDLDAQLGRFHANVAKLFKDVNVEGFLDKLSGILSIVDQSTESGKALHDVLTDAFDGVYKVIEKVEPYAEIFFLGLELAALKVANAIRVVAYHLGITIGGDNQDALTAFEDTMLSFADAVGRVANGIAILAQYQFVWDGFSAAGAILEFAAEATWDLARPLLAVPLAIAELGAAALLAVDWLSRFGDEAERSGESIVTGLIAGIMNSASQLYDAVVAMATKALDKFKGVFGIHSPSRVMAQMGGHMTTGLAQGIRVGANEHVGAMIGAGARLSMGTAAGAQLGMLSHVPRQLAMNDNALANRSDPIRTREPEQRSSNRRGGVVFEAGAFAPGAIQLSGQGAAEIAGQLEEVFANVMEKAALMNGTS